MDYCIARELSPRAQERLRRSLATEHDVEMIVERRRSDRRRGGERRLEGGGPPVARLERRRIRSQAGRRCGERRAALAVVRGRPLPRPAQRFADRIALVKRIEPPDHALEDVEAARVVTRVQAGDTDAFADLYLCYFGRVWGY